MKKIVLSVTMIVLVLFAEAQQPPSPASDILKEAAITATKENKNVFVMFHASWCGWCKRMDKSMQDASCKKFFDENYVTAHLVVDESKDKKGLENPGASDTRDNYNGKGQGLPYWVVLDKNGTLLADSRMEKPDDGGIKKGDNVGCPASEEEVAYFISVVKKTSSLSADQLEIIRKRFRENDK